ncbi:MAG: stage III sporulation protein AB [Faecousia sp.]
MVTKLLGAVCVMAGCGGCGLAMILHRKKTENWLSELSEVLSFMEWELQYRMTPLPFLCESAAAMCKTGLKKLFSRLSEELRSQFFPNAEICMRSSICATADIPEPVAALLNTLGSTLGKFDAEGQIQGIRGVRARCEEQRAALRQDRANRLRSIETLWLCAGAALVILFL